MATALIQKMKLDKGAFLHDMGKLGGEFREPNHKDKVTRFPSVSYARQLGLLVNTLGSHLKVNHLILGEVRCEGGAEDGSAKDDMENSQKL